MDLDMTNENLELDDFTLEKPNYVVWAFSYDENDLIIGDHFVADFGDDPETAVDFAKKLALNVERLKNYACEGAKYVQIEVETVITVEDYTQNAGSIFIDHVEI